MPRNSFDLLTKKQVIDELDNGTSYEVIKSRFGFKSHTNIVSIKKNREKIIASFNSNQSPLNKTMVNQKRFILLFIDNCTAHGTNLNFSNVKIVFLPQNTTSRTQPMDAGVIKCLKGYYRLKITRKIISLVENKQKVDATTIKLFQAIEYFNSAWDNEMKPEIISNCFRHCGFYKAKCRTEPVTPESEFEKLNENFLTEFGESDLETFVDADKNLVTCAQAEESVTDNLSEQKDIDSADEGEEEHENIEELKIISKLEALSCIDTLKLFAVQSGSEDDSQSMLKLIRAVENSIYARQTKLVQKRLVF